MNRSPRGSRTPPTIKVILHVDISRGLNDTSTSENIVLRFAQDFWKRHWPWETRPEVWFDPRALAPERGERACLHAKFVAVDREKILVTSANFTEAAQQRNVEAGILLRSPGRAAQLVTYFEAMRNNDSSVPSRGDPKPDSETMKSSQARRAKTRSSGKPAATPVLAPVVRPAAGIVSATLAVELRSLIQSARSQVAQATNAALTTLYWQIGTRIRQDVLKQRRAEYGAEVVTELGDRLEQEFGRGFGEKNLRRMVQFAEAFPDSQIVASLLRQLGWTHFTLLIPLKEPLKREFYAEMCRVQAWSTRTLREKIDGMLYERTALSKKPDQLIRQEVAALRESDQLTPDLVFQDPYFLDFLGLHDHLQRKESGSRPA